MLGRILLDNDYFLVTAGLLGSIKATLKSRGLTLKATREERTKLLDVLDELKRRGYSVEPDSKEFEEILDGFSEALLGRGGYRWQAYFLVTTCENIVSGVIGESDSSNFEWKDISRFFDWDGRPAVIAFTPDGPVSGWVVRSGDNAGLWTEANPTLISASGRLLSSEVFHEVFADRLTDVEKVDSSVTLPLDFTTAVRFFSLDWRPAVITRSDEVVEGWFSPEAGKPFRPLELGDILSNGRELSKADFQEMFPDDVAGADAITSNIDLPNTVSFDWNDVSAFFDWEGRPAVTVTPSDGLLEGWFIQTSSEPGVWGRASPLEIRDSGRPLSKESFQECFDDRLGLH